MSVALLPAVQQLRLLRNKEISSAELVEEYIGRIERINPSLNAIVDFDPSRVRAQAKEERRGALAGLPITVKSSISVAGYLCETGSTLWRGNVAQADAVAVGR